ncbi:hypothetical protein BDN72DRAFT_378308 [Pluteus cervinus]|uniref:Uncharacterized protein n=1 Tax=Pluteus cervinus TaxID=181527 RepID=A0ACD3B395_9AGAR|nr:hypothetical protein BDN72DRAFT_378308 [Pluteus cervinus]
MDVATSLPPELWHIILSFLFSKDIQQLTLAHSALYACSRPFLWQAVNLCSMRKSDRVKARAILRTPALGMFVRHLRLKPANFEQPERFSPRLGWYTKNPTNVWVCDASIKTWYDVAKRIDWEQPTRPFWDFKVSRKTAEMAVKLAPFLTNVRKITFQPRFYEEIHPDPCLYCQILRNICPNQVRCLNLNFCSGSALQLFAKIIRELQITFQLLDSLALYITVYSDVSLPWDFKSDIKAVADVGRASLQSLDVSWSVNPTFPSMEHLLDGLGLFPNLSRFNLISYTRKDFGLVTGFLIKHHVTLSHIELGNNLNDLVTLLSGNSYKLLRLSSIKFINQNMRWPYILAVQPSLSFYANTLTTLVIQNTMGLYLGLTYEHLSELISSLNIPGHGSCLRRLRIPIAHLSPEVFDIMSNHLQGLQILDLAYRHLVGDKSGSRMHQPDYFISRHCSGAT